jgi:hypothetical protein
MSLSIDPSMIQQQNLAAQNEEPEIVSTEPAPAANQNTQIDLNQLPYADENQEPEASLVEAAPEVD